MKKKLKFIIPIPILLVVLGVAYTMFLAPKPAAAKPPKVAGTLVPLTGDFVINLAGGHYGKLSVAVLLSSAPARAAPGPGPLPGEAPVPPGPPAPLTNLDPPEPAHPPAPPP